MSHIELFKVKLAKLKEEFDQYEQDKSRAEKKAFVHDATAYTRQLSQKAREIKKMLEEDQKKVENKMRKLAVLSSQLKSVHALMEAKKTKLEDVLAGLTDLKDEIKEVEENPLKGDAAKAAVAHHLHTFAHRLHSLGMHGAVSSHPGPEAASPESHLPSPVVRMHPTEWSHPEADVAGGPTPVRVQPNTHGGPFPFTQVHSSDPWVSTDHGAAWHTGSTISGNHVVGAEGFYPDPSKVGRWSDLQPGANPAFDDTHTPETHDAVQRGVEEES